MAVIDASVYVALMNAHEAEHANSWAWFRQVQSAQEVVSAPAILLAEVASALSRGVGDPALARRVVEQLQRTQVIDLAPVTLTLAQRAAEIAADYQVRGCDAVYIALAEQSDDYLVTLDGQQLERGGKVITASRPTLWPARS